MLFKALSAAVYGIDAHIIDVEVDYSGIRTLEDHFHTVGLPDAAVRESRDRVRAAIKNSGFEIPPTQITINLAPADLKKEGSGFDLPMAIGILGAYGCCSWRPQPVPAGRRVGVGWHAAFRSRRTADRRRRAHARHSQPARAPAQCVGGRGGRGRERLSYAHAEPGARAAQLRRQRRHSYPAASRRYRAASRSASGTSRSISKMFAGNKPPNVLSRFPPPAATTFS